MIDIYWIGLHKETPRPGEKTGWKWLDGTPYGYGRDRWSDGEPEGGNNEECVILSGYSHKWFDHPCLSIQRFICKRSKWMDFTLKDLDRVYSDMWYCEDVTSIHFYQSTYKNYQLSNDILIFPHGCVTTHTTSASWQVIIQILYMPEMYGIHVHKEVDLN